MIMYGLRRACAVLVMLLCACGATLLVGAGFMAKGNFSVYPVGEASVTVRFSPLKKGVARAARGATVVLAVVAAAYGVYQLGVSLFYIPSSVLFDRSSRCLHETNILTARLVQAMRADNHAQLRMIGRPVLLASRLAEDTLLRMASCKRRPYQDFMRNLNGRMAALAFYRRKLEERSGQMVSGSGDGGRAWRARMAERASALGATLSSLMELERVMRYHQSFFELYDQESLVRELYGDRDLLRRIDIVSEGTNHPYVAYASRLGSHVRELRNLIRRADLRRYRHRYEVAANLAETLEARLARVRNCSVHREQRTNAFWDRVTHGLSAAILQV